MREDQKPGKIQRRSVDLSVMPAVDSSLETQVTVGDGHGNTLLLIFQLIKKGFMKLESEKDYHRLTEIYKEWTKKHLPDLAKDRETLAKDRQKAINSVNKNSWKTPKRKKKFDEYQKIIKEFTRILDRATIIDQTTVPDTPERLFRSIGDFVCDRGASDLFTLLTVFKIFPSDMKLEILHGNHDQEFLWFWANDFPPPNHFIKQNVSYANLYDLIQNEVVDKETVNDLVENYFLPNLRLLSYSTNDEIKSASIFKHAPTSDPLQKKGPDGELVKGQKQELRILKLLAKHYLGENADTLDLSKRVNVVNIINQVNNEFLKRILEDKKQAKNEILAIQEQIDKRSKAHSDRKIAIEKDYFTQISNIFINGMRNNLDLPKENDPLGNLDQKQIVERFKNLVSSFGFDTKFIVTCSLEKFMKILEDIISRFPKDTRESIKKEINKLTDRESYKSEVAKILSFLPWELFKEMKSDRQRGSIANLGDTFDNIPQILERLRAEQTKKHDNEREKKIQCLTEASLLKANFDTAKHDNSTELMEKYPLGALLWERLDDIGEPQMPETFEGEPETTQLFSITGHDEPKKERDINSKKQNLHSELGKPENSKTETDYSKGFPIKINEFISYSNFDELPAEPEIVKKFRLQAREKIALQKLETALSVCKEYADPRIQEFLSKLNTDKSKVEDQTRIDAIENEINTVNTIKDLTKISVKKYTPKSSPIKAEENNLEAVAVRSIEVEEGAAIQIRIHSDAEAEPLPDSAAKPDHPNVPQQEEGAAKAALQTALHYQESDDQVNLPKKLEALTSMLDPLKTPNELASTKLTHFYKNLNRCKKLLATHRKAQALVVIGLTLLTAILPPIGLAILLFLMIHSKVKHDSYAFYKTDGFHLAKKLEREPEQTVTHKLFK